MADIIISACRGTNKTIKNGALKPRFSYQINTAAVYASRSAPVS
jgi:hypothetical protein